MRLLPRRAAWPPRNPRGKPSQCLKSKSHRARQDPSVQTLSAGDFNHAKARNLLDAISRSLPGVTRIISAVSAAVERISIGMAQAERHGRFQYSTLDLQWQTGDKAGELLKIKWPSMSGNGTVRPRPAPNLLDCGREA